MIFLTPFMIFLILETPGKSMKQCNILLSQINGLLMQWMLGKCVPSLTLVELYLFIYDHYLFYMELKIVICYSFILFLVVISVSMGNEIDFLICCRK